MKRQFYVSDFDANGLQDLIVTDIDGNILDRRNACIYGLHVRPDKGFPALNTVVVKDAEMRKSLMDVPESLTFVYEAPISVLQRHVATGPDCDEEKTREFLSKYEAKRK